MESNIVKMSQMQISSQGTQLKTNSLGSCIGVALYDHINQIGGLAHIMLPSSNETSRTIGKYADLAIPALCIKMLNRGASIENMSAMLFGGANMFLDTFTDDFLLIGKQNVAISKNILTELNIKIVAEDIGGTNGRNIVFSCKDGSVTVSNFDSPPQTYYFQ